jgi:hypothetical protein
MGRAALLVVLLATSCSFTPDWAGPGRSSGASEELAEELRRESSSYIGRIRQLEHAERRGTLGVRTRILRRPAAGWAGERVWDRRGNDWEPAIAADPSSALVYQLTTRYGTRFCRRCPDPWIVLRTSPDGGATWSKDAPLCRCRNGKSQHDPQIEVATDGTVYAAWLDNFNPGVAFTKSTDRGATWSKPVYVHADLKFSDKPILAISADGRDVYLAFNASDSFVVASHDFGETFSAPVQSNEDGRYYFAGGGYVAPDGTVTFAETSYHQNSRGRVRMLTVSSTDGGQTWRQLQLESFREWPPCTSRGCARYYYGPQAAIAGDADGDLVLISNGAVTPGGKQRIYAHRSTDGGVTWTERLRLSPRNANAAFPAAVGAGDGDIRMWFMDDRRREDRAWNVWYRRSTDGGLTWTPAVRISDGRSGSAYKAPGGFREPYGDYGEIAVLSSGATIAIWGEGRSYFGPGGSWFNRQV